MMTTAFPKTPLPPVAPIEAVPGDFIESGWFANEAARRLGNSTIYALIHADDGVIWARVENGAPYVKSEFRAALKCHFSAGGFCSFFARL